MKNKINTDKIKEHHKELETYNGYIPLLFNQYIDSQQRLKNIKKLSNYEKIRLENLKHRQELLLTEDFEDYLLEDIQKWIKENKEWDGILNG